MSSKLVSVFSSGEPHCGHVIILMGKEKGHPLQGAPYRVQGLALRENLFNQFEDCPLVLPIIDSSDDL